MPKSTIGGKGFNPGSADVRAKGRSQETDATRPVEKVGHERLDPDDIPLPEIQEGFSTQKSGLQGVIEAGLTRLAAAEGFQAQDKALGVLVRAMAGAAGTAEPPEAFAGVLTGELRQALASAPEASTIAPVELRRDATQLLTLATAALGTEDLPASKSKAEAVLVEDIRLIKDALADVLKRADRATVERLQETQSGLSWAADVLSRGQSALQKAESTAATRMDALAGVLRIVLKYAEHGAR